jgi:hypothetical protein
MMKRLAALLIVLVICFSMSGCKHQDSDSSSESSEESSSLSSASAGSVEVTIPKAADNICGSYFSDNSSRLGISTPTSNGDGSISFTITSNSKDELIRNARVLLNEKLETLKTSNSFITSINFDRNLTTLTCLADSTSYQAPSESFFETCYIPLIACLAVEGKAEDTIKSYSFDVVFVDKDNFSMISKYTYPNKESENSSSTSSTVISDGTQSDSTDSGDTYTTDDYTYTDDSYSDDTYTYDDSTYEDYSDSSESYDSYDYTDDTTDYYTESTDEYYDSTEEYYTE